MLFLIIPPPPHTHTPRRISIMSTRCVSSPRSRHAADLKIEKKKQVAGGARRKRDILSRVCQCERVFESTFTEKQQDWTVGAAKGNANVRAVWYSKNKNQRRNRLTSGLPA